ncbi:zeatin o-glucosyltransferase [Phtheirospermum japonicum]|uniref:Zeatin o-glucosyltransferase n=1 Tax=Phtheirospermum japonicum TaxID=374723 RepID=A0A830BZT3_9LAMI|nr:zeatin o-glucosyltransferase [Phtheirospermum japonicum]
MSAKNPLVMLMVPLPAQGHLNQLLHLSRRIATHDIPVHFAASATHNRQATTRAHVLRDADKGDVFEGDVRRAPLPEGFESRVKERGLIVRDWAPQLEILGHPSVGGFISHCGLNSCMESISMGVPIIAWPMHSDQPKNAVLMTKVLKIGMPIKDWDRRDEVISSDAVEKAVRKLMASEEGAEMRKSAAELEGSVKKSLMKGGITSKEMGSFRAHISRPNSSTQVIRNFVPRVLEVTSDI